MKEDVLTWSLSDQLFGVSLESCKEVHREVALTTVPHAQHYLSGIVNIRGDVVTVINLGKLLGYTDAIDNKHGDTINVIRLKPTGTGIMAENVEDIIQLESENYEPARAHLEEAPAKYVRAVAITDRGPILLLRTDQFASSGRVDEQ